MSFLTIARALFAMLFVFVTVITVIPNPEETTPGFAFTRWLADLLLGDAQSADKIGHFVAYGALGASAALADIRLFGKAAASIVALAVYGALLEGVQALGGVRDPEYLDAAANAAGALAGYPLMTVIKDAALRRARS